MNYAVIMAGGSGTRLWPLSRQNRPKQTLKLTGERSLYQRAVERLLPLFPLERILVIACPEHTDLLRQQPPYLPPENYFVEPEGRGTAPAVGLAAIHLKQRDPEALMAVLTADHDITDVAAFQRALMAALDVASRGFLVTLGIRPESPSTGFGYIQQGESLGTSHGLEVFRAVRFIEKPDRETAAQMVASGRWSWNSGMFIWRVERILREFQRQMPALYEQLMCVQAALAEGHYAEVLEQVWPTISKQTIDYGIMEGAEEVAVVPVEIGWTDVGSWEAVRRLLPADSEGNTLIGPHLALDTRDTFVFGSKRLIATLGVQDLVIVDADDALLVCARGREQEVKEIVEALKARSADEWV